MGEFSNQNVFISGATSGIGRAAAVAFGREGARVGVFGRNEEAALRVCGEIASAGGEGVLLTGDVRSKAAVDAAMAHFLDGDRPLNLAVNAAGLDIAKEVRDYTEEEARAVLETNTLGLMFCLQAEIVRMRMEGAGAIVNVTSIAGTKVIVGNGIYNASKSAAAMLTRTAAAEEGPNGIRINEVAPGPVDTPMLRGFFDDAEREGMEWGAEQIRQALPLRRIGEPDDIAGPVLFLCSERARYITGACLAADGGFLVS